MKKKILLLLALIGFGYLAGKFGLGYWHKQKQDQQLLAQDREYLTKKAAKLKEWEQAEKNEQIFCDNAYLPWIPGSAWRYDVRKGDEADILELRIGEPREGKSYLSSVLTGRNWNFETEFSCAEEGIMIATLGLFRSLDQIGTISTPIEQTGFWLPRDIAQTNSWNFDLEIQQDVLKPESLTEIERSYVEKTVGMLNQEEGEEMETAVGKFVTKKISAQWVISKVPRTEDGIDFAETVECEGGDCNIQRTVAELGVWLAEQTGVVRATYQERGSEPIISEIRSFQVPAVR